MTRAQQLLSEVVERWEPPKQLSVSQWADLNFKLSPEYAAEAGDWSTLSFQRDPLDTISDPTVWQTVIKSCTQLLKTTVIQIGTAYVIDQDPGPILIVQPRDDDAKAFSKERIAPMLRDVPCLRGKVSDSKAKTSANTIEEKWFRGGLLACTAAGSPGNLARRAIRFLFCDEEDKWVISSGSEGKPFNLALKRTATFRHRKKAIRCCSPTRSGSSIDKAYEESDQREFHVPCPHCGAEQSMMLKFRTQVRWSDDPALTKEQRAKTALYHCEACDAGWTDTERHAAVERGRWVANAPFSGVAGFWISELYSPWKQLWEIVLDWLKAQCDREALVAFVNTSLAENWEEPGEQLEWRTLVDRREDYPVGTIPAGGLFLTSFVDVQRADGGRLEARVMAYGENRERWAVDYRIFYGDPTDLDSPDSPWRKVESMLIETWPTSAGAELPIVRMYVDSGDGAVTPFVYEWARKQPQPRVWAVKGDSRCETPVSAPKAVEVTRAGKRYKYGVVFKTVNVDYFKAQLYADLRRRPPTPEELDRGVSYPQGYFHMPADEAFGDAHCQQMCSERRQRSKNGRKEEWKQDGRNEAWDTAVGCDAAAWDFGGNAATPADWAKRRAKVRALEPDPQPAATIPGQQSQPAPAAVVAPRVKPRRIVRSRYLS
jgi:phage terminase large subunit GpA-like protein